MGATNFICWNVNGIRASVKKGFYDKIKELDPDVLCLQETKATVDIVKDIATEMDGYECYANEAEKKGYSGTAIFTKTPPLSVLYDLGVPEHDNEGRVITLEFDNYYLVNTYVPNSGANLVRLDYRKTWDKAMNDYLSDLQKKKPVVFCGDLNVAREPIDLARPDSNYNKTAGYTRTEIDGINTFLDSGLIDSFRELHPERVAYSFWNVRFKARERNVGWRIDYFLVSEGLRSSIQKADVLDQVMGSDHCPIQLVIGA